MHGRIWKEIENNVPMGECEGHQTTSKDTMKKEQTLEQKVDAEQRLNVCRASRDGLCKQPNGYRGRAKNATSDGGPGPARKERYTSRRLKEEETHRTDPVEKQQKTESTLWENMNDTRRNGTC